MPPRHPFSLCLLRLLAATAAGQAHPLPEPKPATIPISAASVEVYRREVGPVLAKYCVKCHSGEKPKAGFDMEKLDLRQLTGAQSKKWMHIAEQLRIGEMPPEEKPQPTAEESRKVVSWLTAELRLGGVDTTLLEATLSGRYLDHDALFSGPLAPLDNPPRVWRFSPEIYAAWVLRQSPGQTAGQAMTASSEPGFKDQAPGATIDQGVLAVVLRNAQQVAAARTAHTIENGAIVPGKGTGGEIVVLLDPKVPLDRAKLAGWINSFAFYRRWGRYSPKELEPLLALYDKAEKIGGREAALRTVLVAVQLQPESLYRLELGLGPADKRGYRLLGPRELAYAISFAFGFTLDRNLSEAAGSGKLATREDAAREVKRIMDEPKFPKPQILQFFQEYFGYDTAPDVFKDNVEKENHHAATLVRDTDLLILHVLEKDQDVLRTLLKTNLSFVAATLDAKTGTVSRSVPKRDIHHNYGLAEWPAAQPVALPAAERAGVLTQPSWLVAQSGNFDNHPVQRGRWVREHLLGGSIPPIPITVNAQVPDEPSRPLRDRLNQVTKVEYCWQCHSRMNQLGLPFEQYDHFGRFRTAQWLIDPTAPPLPPAKKGATPIPAKRSLPLDVSGSIDRSGDPKLDGPAETPVAMIKRLAESPRTRQVFVRYAFRFWMGRDENLGDAATLRAADEAYVKSGGSMKALIASLLTSDSFLYRTVPKTELALTGMTRNQETGAGTFQR